VILGRALAGLRSSAGHFVADWEGKGLTGLTSSTLFNHTTASLSARDREMIGYIHPGGNWTQIPEDFPSARIRQIREMTKKRGGIVRTTYYGRLRWDRPAYTISTYFSRVGNGCFIHPDQPRLLSIREAARLQSFPDSFRFLGSKTSQYKQVGNAVPPLLAYAVARSLHPRRTVSLFSGSGGLSLGFQWAGAQVTVANELEKAPSATYTYNFPRTAFVSGDLTEPDVYERVCSLAESLGPVDTVIGGPPCQGFSLAGWHNPKDPRNLLFLRFGEVLGRLRPTKLVMENVQGLLWMSQGQVLKQIVGYFEGLGYDMTVAVLKAEEFGVPQLRRRVFLVGSRDGRVTLPEPSLRHAALAAGEPFNVGDAIRDLPHLSPGGGEAEARYDEEWATSQFQLWARGRVSTAQLLTRRRPAWSMPVSQDAKPSVS
jgi:DNA (cytosine-5)-methyltransferase 1